MMLTSLDYQFIFWGALSDALSVGVDLVSALEQAKTTLSGTPFEQVVSELIAEVSTGRSLHQAMLQQGHAFPRSIRSMVRAGEAAAALDVVAGRIFRGLQEGSFVVPGTPPREGSDSVRYWRSFARLLSSGIPIMEVFDIIAAELAPPALSGATEEIRNSINKGGSMADAMASFPDLFPEEVRAAVARGEHTRRLDWEAFRIADALEAGDLASLGAESPAPPKRLAGAKDQGTIAEAADRLIRQAVASRASDIHIDPTEAGKLRIRLRIDGALHDYFPPDSKEVSPEVIDRFKTMAALAPAEKRLPQTGGIYLELEGKKYDLRLSTLPTSFGDRLVIRILLREIPPLDLPSIIFSPEDLDTVRRLCRLPNGIIICTGPAGSGKTTLLYSLLNEIDRDRLCVVSVEDPIEFHLQGVAQMQAQPQIGLTYPRALRSVLRQDPDVIMVGDVHDLETAQLIVQSALTGHLVFTQMHAPTAPAAVKHLRWLGVEPFALDSSLAAVIAQRLVRRLCPECRQKAKPDLALLPPDAASFISKAKDATFYSAKGCDACSGTGYKGRIAIHHILVPQGRVRDAALEDGMKPLLTDGLERAARGLTSLEEVLRVCAIGPND